MERALRQGNPLSPFLFVLVVDVLHRMVGEAVKNGRIPPLLVGRDNIELSHLQFADDTILFCPPEEETVKNYKRLLRCFELMSGLSINFDKSSLIPINCEGQWVHRMCSLLGCKEVLPNRGGPWKDICQILIKEQHVRDKMITGLSMEEIVDFGMEYNGFGTSNGGENFFSGRWTFWIVFSTNSFVKVLQMELLPEDISSYNFTKTIWKGVVPQRVELFTWFALVGRVNTKDRLSRFGIIRQEDTVCVLCNNDVERFGTFGWKEIEDFFGIKAKVYRKLSTRPRLAVTSGNVWIPSVVNGAAATT
ncbi:uncharacterized protein LOC107491464 [Arachis duranensis]|uniref:Uncharacterized protein LOC107491464 n=1 Tax=Arachis duranensis TaxID=130453 RepID=A0A9C6WVX5_ARADU|nr:uncharacterized protein LOC107491464 [Arachis duranensis]